MFFNEVRQDKAFYLDCFLFLYLYDILNLDVAHLKSLQMHS